MQSYMPYAQYDGCDDQWQVTFAYADERRCNDRQSCSSYGDSQKTAIKILHSSLACKILYPPQLIHEHCDQCRYQEKNLRKAEAFLFIGEDQHKRCDKHLTDTLKGKQKFIFVFLVFFVFFRFVFCPYYIRYCQHQQKDQTDIRKPEMQIHVIFLYVCRLQICLSIFYISDIRTD